MQLGLKPPSPALVISLISLSVAIGGTGYAASRQQPAAAPNGQTAAKGKKPHVIKGPRGPKGDQGIPGPQGSPGLSGAKGDKGDNGAPGTPGTNGANGMKGADGSARAYAHVLANFALPDPTPTLDMARTKGFDSVTRTSAGHYCLTPSAGSGVDRSRQSPVAAIDFQNSDATGPIVTVSPANTACANGGIRVTTLEPALTPGPDIDQSSTANSDAVSFDVMVP